MHTDLAALDTATFKETSRQWILAQGVNDLDLLSLSTDGKMLRETQGHELADVHLLAAYSHARKSVVAQFRVPDNTKLVPLEGALITKAPASIQHDLW